MISASADDLRAALLSLLQEVLQEFSASRAREGEKLKDFLLQRVEKIEALRNGVMPHVPAAIAAYEQKLAARLREAMQGAPAQDALDERGRPMVYLSLTFDHRILDGASADGFLAKIVEILDNWP